MRLNPCSVSFGWDLQSPVPSLGFGVCVNKGHQFFTVVGNPEAPWTQQKGSHGSQLMPSLAREPGGAEGRDGSVEGCIMSQLFL